MRNPAVRSPQPADLTAPVGEFMRPTFTVERGDSLARAAQTLRENGASVLPVLSSDGKLFGALSEAGLARALADSVETTDAVEDYAELADTIEPYASAAEALQRCEDGRTRVVIDDAGRVVGLISPVDLWPRKRRMPKPSTVGGMATPFGVYLTTGNVAAGVPWWALLATGASMGAMMIAAQVAAIALARLGMPGSWTDIVSVALFFVLMRLLPLSGTHGAEHMVVHAIEREEPLAVPVVRRMPLVHPRCGTNLVAAVTLFATVLFAGLGDTIHAEELSWRLLPAAVVALAFGRPFGSLLQRFVTTKTPSQRQLEGAIRSGEELLKRNAAARLSGANPLQRIWNMGLLQVMTGAILMATLFAALPSVSGFGWLSGLLR